MSVGELIDGYRRFRALRYIETRDLYRRLHASGQSPKVMVIACCDSRVDPATITDSSPGQLFVVRNVANLVPPCTPDGGHHGTSAALEFAVRHLEVEDIVVLGHAECGGAKVLLAEPEAATASDFIGSWMTLALPARSRVESSRGLAADDRQRAIEQEIVRLSLANLMTFDWIRERVKQGRLRLHGWYFGIASGVLYVLDEQRGVFHSLL